MYFFKNSILVNPLVKNQSLLNPLAGVIFKEIKLVEWGKILDYDMIINATSVGLSNSEDLNLNFKDLRPNKFFYDVIYNPPETNFLRKAKELNHKIENGKMMFIYQAHQAFTLWHNLMPTIDDKVKELI